VVAGERFGPSDNRIAPTCDILAGMISPRRVLVLLAAFAGTASAQSSTDWRAYSDSAERARQRADWPAYSRLIDSIYAGLGNYPTVLWAQARGAARTGRTERAMERLRTYVATGLTRDITTDSAFLPMLAEAEVQRLKARLEANGAAPVRARVAVTIQDSTFVPESIVHDSASGRFYLSSIAHGTIVRMSANGTIEPLARSRDGGMWSGFGLALDAPRQILWFTSQQIPHYSGFAKADSGRTGVASFDLRANRWRRRFVAPNDSVPHSFGDAAVLGDGTLLVADAEGGAVYGASLTDTALRVIVPRGRFVSPQGIAPAVGDAGFYVADYALGIAYADRVTGRVEILPHPDSIVVAGIDGMIRVGRSLVGVQNGFTPRRVMRYDLDPSGRRIVSSKILESNPAFLGEATHLAHVGGKIYFMARTGFDQFGPDGKLRPGASLVRPIVAVVDLWP
jgi:hypothetical protein